MPIYFGLQLPQRTCSPLPGVYQIFNNIWHLVFWSCLPNLGMVVFSLLTIRNINQGRRRIIPPSQDTQNQQQATRKKTDVQLLRMVIVQSLMLSSTTMTNFIVSLYVSSVSIPTQDALKKSTNDYLRNAFSFVALTGPCMSFYLFTLSSPLFRHELFNLFRYRLRPQNHQTTAVTVRPTQIPKGLSS